MYSLQFVKLSIVNWTLFAVRISGERHGTAIASSPPKVSEQQRRAPSGWLKWFYLFDIIDAFFPFAINMFDIINERASHQEVLLAVLTASDYRRKMIIN